METKEKNTKMKYGMDRQTALYQLAKGIAGPIREIIDSCDVMTLGDGTDETVKETILRLREESQRILQMIEEYVGDSAYCTEDP